MTTKVIWKNWNPQKVKAAIAGEVAQNMEVACKFVVEEARQLAPTRKKSGRRRGTGGRFIKGIGGLLRSEIDFDVEVTARGNVIEGRVGVKRGKAFYARFQELGTRFMTAHPFLRPAVFNNAREIVRIISGR